MPTQIESARFSRISSINVSFIGKKVRVVGRLLMYDAVHGLATLLDVDGKHTVTADVREVLDESSTKWAGERLGTVIVIGYVEESPEEFPSLDAKALARGVLDPPLLVIRAVLVVPAGDLDLGLWDSVIDAEGCC